MSSTGTVQSSTNLFRRLAWNASVPLDIRLAEADRAGAVDRFFIQAPRYTYLALLLPTIRENLVELALDDEALARTDESQWWFEEDVGEGARFAGMGACKWHWPIDLLELHSVISTPARAGDDTTPSTPLRLILHLSGKADDKLGSTGGLDAVKTQFVNQVKEADFVRWGNTKRVTGLRRADLEAGWDGVASGDFDLHARMASRVVPLPIPIPPGNGGNGGSGMHSRPPSTEPGATPNKLESAYAARSLPIKIYLPDGAPAIQHVVPPTDNGRPTTLVQLLRTHLPLLFPQGEPYALAQPLAQGIVLPPDAEVAWLAACMAGADGWLRIGVRLVGE